MDPSTDAPEPAPQTATENSATTQPGDASPAAPSESPDASPAAPPESPDALPSAPSESPAVPEIAPPPPLLFLYTLLGLLCIGVSLWIIFAWTGYKDRYSQQTEGWSLGATKMIEVTLIREDKKNLACASDRSFEGIHCAFHANSTPWGPGPEQDSTAVQPFNTIKNELFLASGLWSAPVLQGELPTSRFTVVCNYHVKGVLKNVSLRWSSTGNFSPVDQSVTIGTLTDCVIPQ